MNGGEGLFTSRDDLSIWGQYICWQSHRRRSRWIDIEIEMNRDKNKNNKKDDEYDEDNANQVR